MTKIRLANGIILDATNVELKNGVLSLKLNSDKTVEELAILFRNKTNTALITLMTENRTETGYKRGFTSFAGINYNADGTKTIELFQPKDVMEARLADTEGKIVQVNNAVAKANSQSSNAMAAATNLEMSILDTQIALAELAEMMLMTEESEVEEEIVVETESEPAEIPMETPTEGGNE